MKKVEIGKVKIRFAKPDDFEEINTLLEELTQAIKKVESPSTYVLKAPKSSRRNIFNKIRASENKIFIAKYEGRIVGFVNFQLILNVRYGWTRGHIEEIIVKDGFRGKGIGSLLLTRIKVWCKKNGVKVIKVAPNKKFKETQKFFEKNGFVSKYKGYRLDLK